MSDNLESGNRRGPFLWVIRLSLVVVMLSPSLGFTQNGLGLIPPASGEDHADLSGEWIFQDLRLQVNQTGTDLTGRILDVSHIIQDWGYRSGDVIFRGELEGRTIHAKWLIPTPEVIRHECPNDWTRWKDLDIPLSPNFQGMPVSFSYQPFKAQAPHAILCEEDPKTNRSFFMLLAKRPMPQPEKPLRPDVFFRLHVGTPGLPGEPGKPVDVSIDLVDGKGLNVQADHDLTITLSSTLGDITSGPFIIPRGESSGKGTFLPREPGMATISASSHTYVTHTTLTIIQTGKEGGNPSKPVMVDLILDQPGGPVGFPLEVKVVLRDDRHNPTVTEKSQTLTFRLSPLSLTPPSAETPPGVETSQNTTTANTRTVENGELLNLDFSLGGWELKAVVEKGWSGFAFKIARDEAGLLDIQVGGAKLSGSRDTLISAEEGDPENLLVLVQPDQLRANGTDQSEVRVAFVGPSKANKDTLVPKCGSLPEYDVTLQATLGAIIQPSLATLTTVRCHIRNKDAIRLTASTNPGTATVTAVSSANLRGTKHVRFTLMPPALYQFLLALVGGSLGGLLQGYRHHSQENLPRPFMELFNFSLFISAIIGLTLYLATYYGSFELHFNFYKHGVFAAFIGLVGGFVGFPVLDKIAEKFGFTTAPKEKDQTIPS